MQSEANTTIVNGLDDLRTYIGKEIGVSSWKEISQERINTFAEITEDLQWIHVDVERSKKESPYKTPIAHGFLVLSMASAFSYEAYQLQGVGMGVNYGLNRVRFTNAVPAGAMIRGKFTLKEVKEIPGGARFVNELVIEIQGVEKPACIAEWIGQAYFVQ